MQARYPRLRAEAIGYLSLGPGATRREAAERWLAVCLRAARDGLAGLDFRVDPYDTEANPAHWAVAYCYAERAVNAGLGITIHAGEFSTANLAAALRVPGLTRLGHATYAAAEPRLLAALAERGVTVECCLSCNIVAGAVTSYEAHPIRQFVDAGIAVTLNTDDPVRVCTTIGREYALATALGFSVAGLLAFTRTAIEASFTTAARKAAMLREVRDWAAQHPHL